MVVREPAMDWRQQCAEKLVSPEEAVKVVRSGDVVWAGGWTSVPVTLCDALARRRGELRDVRLYTFLSPYPWDQPGIRDSFEVITAFASPADRKGVQEGRIEYLPVSQFKRGHLPPGVDHAFDVALIPISPPDRHGFCSFGAGVWFGPTISRHATTLVGEVHEEYIRTGGENYIHVSQFERLTVAGPPAPPPIPPRSEEVVYAAEVICTLVATELIRDGDTLQMGVGDVSAALAVYLQDKHDLGIHTEIIPGGVASLVQQGVVTGRYKTLHPGKVVGSSFVQLSPEELDYVDGNPVFELYDFTYTDDLRNLLQLEHFKAINNALAVDLTGNICAETRGASIFSGPGGQTVFCVAASYTSGGAIIVLPSSQLVDGQRVSRVVPVLDQGSAITVQRGFVDYVVTEQGIARLRGKTLRQRVSELIAVAHPDFRGELRQQARRYYGLDV
ncbi:MAG TPA: acetyl-CoA hydrolase/transferase C-terminal domain-containing protein [Dehalococcoidia bacterium]